MSVSTAAPMSPRRRRTRRRPTTCAVTVAVVGSLLLGACGAASGGAASADTDEHPTTTERSVDAPEIPRPVPTTDVAETPLLDALLATRIDGQMPLEGAMTAFAAAYGGLPGVEPASLGEERIEGTTAARWLAAHADELTDDQRAAVDTAMNPLDIDGSPLSGGSRPSSASANVPHGMRSVATLRPAAPSTSISGERGCFGGSFPFADAPGAGKYTDLVHRALEEVGWLLGPLDIPVYTAFSDFEGVNADLNPWAPDCDQPAQACQIRLAPLALQMTDDALVKTLSHELTHCYQARTVGATVIGALPDWLIEGFPSFIAETVGASIGANAPNYWWDKWFKRPGTPLYDRTYDALGFYAVIDQAGGDPMGSYLAALATQDSSAAFHQLIEPVADHFGSIWGATHFRQQQRGLFWELNGPGTTDYQPLIPTVHIADGGGYSAAPAEAQADAELFDLQAEVVTLRLDGAAKGRYSFDDQADETITTTVEWCTLGYPCVCPDDTARAGTVVDQAPGSEVAIGIAGIDADGTMQITGMTFEDYCGPKVPTTTAPPVPPAVDMCLIGTWTSEPWTLPGPPGLDLDLHGGAGISMAINREGLVTTDFTAMADMSGFIPQHQSGGATQEITATQGVVEALRTSIQMDAGPGVFAIWTDSSRYRCDADSFTLTNRDPVEGTDVSIRFASAS